MEDIEQRALDRAMVRRGEIPVPMAGQQALPTPPLPPASARIREAAASTSADGMREGIAGLDRAVRGVGQVVGEVLDVRNMAREIGAAVQGVEPVLVEEAITRGALRPLTPQDLAATDGPDEREHFSWDGKLYARRFTDPETGETVDVTTPDTAFGRLSRLGRWMGASMAVDADIAGPAAAARALRGERRAAGSVRSGVGPEPDEALRDMFVAASRAPPTGRNVVDLGELDPAQVATINERLRAADVSADVSGYRHVVDAYAARHVWKAHGSAETEMPRGQLPITADDWARIPEIVRNPDDVQALGTTRIGLQGIGYWKRLDASTVVYVEEVRTGRRELAAVSMRKFRAVDGVEPGRPDGPKAPQSHVQDALPGSDPTIAPRAPENNDGP